MSFVSWVDNMTSKMKWYDYSLLKLCVFALALWLAIVWPPVLSLNTWIYFGVWIVLMIYFLVKMFK